MAAACLTRPLRPPHRRSRLLAIPAVPVDVSTSWTLLKALPVPSLSVHGPRTSVGRFEPKGSTPTICGATSEGHQIPRDHLLGPLSRRKRPAERPAHPEASDRLRAPSGRFSGIEVPIDR